MRSRVGLMGGTSRYKVPFDRKGPGFESQPDLYLGTPYLSNPLLNLVLMPVFSSQPAKLNADNSIGDLGSCEF